MKNKKKHKYGTGNIVDDFPHYPDNYRDLGSGLNAKRI